MADGAIWSGVGVCLESAGPSCRDKNRSVTARRTAKKDAQKRARNGCERRMEGVESGGHVGSRRRVDYWGGHVLPSFSSGSSLD